MGGVCGIATVRVKVRAGARIMERIIVRLRSRVSSGFGLVQGLLCVTVQGMIRVTVRVGAGVCFRA